MTSGWSQEDLASVRRFLLSEVRRGFRKLVAKDPITGGADLALVSALQGWSDRDLDRLAMLQFVLTEEVEELLVATPTLVRTLANSTSRYEEITNEQLRGPVLWSETFSLRAAVGSPSVWVTAPARRDFQTAENKMLVLVLDAVVDFGTLIDVDIAHLEDIAAYVRARVNEADHLRQHRSLQEIERSDMSARDVIRVKTGRARLRYEPVVRAYERYEHFIRIFEHQAKQETLEDSGLQLTPEDTLFALLTLFNIIDVLNENGWTVDPLGLVEGYVQTTARSADGRELSLWFRGVRHDVLGSWGTGLAVAGDSPDVSLMWTDPSGAERRLAVRCDLVGATAGQEPNSARVLDRLRHDDASFDLASHAASGTYGLGVAWGSGVSADLSAGVTVCTSDRLGTAITSIVR